MFLQQCSDLLKVPVGRAMRSNPHSLHSRIRCIGTAAADRVLAAYQAQLQTGSHSLCEVVLVGLALVQPGDSLEMLFDRLVPGLLQEKPWQRDREISCATFACAMRMQPKICL